MSFAKVSYIFTLLNNFLMQSEENLRIDKWLWAVRIFKTRNIATNACKKQRVQINNIAVKPSRIIKLNEVIYVKHPPIIRTYRVKGLLSKRLAARLVLDYVEDITPEEELQKVVIIKNTGFVKRNKGMGRPTKKERRIIDRFRS